eukprot:COSAG02_NODE_8877_length_2412_cov_1.696930_1_plen_97_part_10
MQRRETAYAHRAAPRVHNGAARGASDRAGSPRARAARGFGRAGTRHRVDVFGEAGGDLRIPLGSRIIAWVVVKMIYHTFCSRVEAPLPGNISSCGVP